MREENILRKILRIIALIVVSVIFLGPFLWMVFTSFKPLAEALRLPPTFLPETWQPQNYVDAWNSGPFLHYTKKLYYSHFISSNITIVNHYSSKLCFCKNGL